MRPYRRKSGNAVGLPMLPGAVRGWVALVGLGLGRRRVAYRASCCAGGWNGEDEVKRPAMLSMEELGRLLYATSPPGDGNIVTPTEWASLRTRWAEEIVCALRDRGFQIVRMPEPAEVDRTHGPFWFVMLGGHNRGNPIPMTTDFESGMPELAVFRSETEARDAAAETPLGKAYGYEVYQWEND